MTDPLRQQIVYTFDRDPASRKVGVLEIPGDCPSCGLGPNAQLTYGDAANPLSPTSVVSRGISPTTTWEGNASRRCPAPSSAGIFAPKRNLLPVHLVASAQTVAAAMTPSKVRAPALSLLLLCAAACTGEWVTITATEPLERIVLSPSGEAFVHVQPGVELEELVSTEPFRDKGLRPEMTAAEVAQILGEPDYLSRDRDGLDEVFGFRAEAGDFEVVKQHVSSEETEVDRWFVRYRPHDCAPLLDPRLLRQVQGLEPFPRKVTVLAGSALNDVASIRFDEDHTCSAIWWLQQEGVESR